MSLKLLITNLNVIISVNIEGLISYVDTATTAYNSHVYVLDMQMFVNNKENQSILFLMTPIYCFLITEARLCCVVAAGPKVICTIINILLLYIQFMLIPSVHPMYSKTISYLYFLFVHIFYFFSFIDISF